MLSLKRPQNVFQVINGMPVAGMGNTHKLKPAMVFPRGIEKGSKLFSMDQFTGVSIVG